MTNLPEIFYVYDGQQVKKTGRRAKREIKRPKGEPMVMYLYEITPADGCGWLKWITESELYEIE